MDYLLRGFLWLGKRELRIYIFIPLLINILLFAGLIYLGFREFSHLSAWVEGWLPHWLVWLRWLLWPLFFIGAVLFLTYGFTFLANLISAPFNSFLALRVERLVTGREQESRSFLAEIPYAIKMQLRILLYFILRALIIVVLLFIPVIQLAVPVLWFTFSAWMMALQYLDYPAENHYLSFIQLKQHLAECRGKALGFGGSVMLASLIPLLNLFVMPAAVIGATLWWVENYNVHCGSKK